MRRKMRQRKMATMRKMKMYGHRGRDHVAAQEEEREDGEEEEGGAVEEREGTCKYMYVKNTRTNFLSNVCNRTCNTKLY